MAYNFARSCDHFAIESVLNQNYSNIKLVLNYLEEVHKDFPELPDVLFILVVYNISLIGQKYFSFLRNYTMPSYPETIEQMENDEYWKKVIVRIFMLLSQYGYFGKEE